MNAISSPTIPYTISPGAVIDVWTIQKPQLSAALF